MTTHRNREKQAKRILKASKRQCRIMGCHPTRIGTGHVIECNWIGYRMAAADAIQNLLTDDRAQQFGGIR